MKCKILFAILVVGILSGCSSKQVITQNTNDSEIATEAISDSVISTEIMSDVSNITYEVGSSGEWTSGKLNVGDSILYVPCSLDVITEAGFKLKEDDTLIKAHSNRTLTLVKGDTTIQCIFNNLADDDRECYNCVISSIRAGDDAVVNGLIRGSDESSIEDALGKSWSVFGDTKSDVYTYKTNGFDYSLELTCKNRKIDCITIYCSSAAISNFARSTFGIIES